MRITISINDEQYPEVINHINKLKKSGANISKFLSDAAKEYILDGDARERRRLKALIKEVIKEEGLVLEKIPEENPPKEELGDELIVDEKDLMRDRLNSMFKDMESDYS